MPDGILIKSRIVKVVVVPRATINISNANGVITRTLSVEIFETAENGTIAAGAAHISIAAVEGTGTFNGFAISSTDDAIDLPPISGGAYPELTYTVAANSRLKIMVVR